MSNILKLKNLSELDLTLLIQGEEDEENKVLLMKLDSLIGDIKELLSEPDITDANLTLSDINGLLDSLDDLKSSCSENHPILDLEEVAKLEETLMEIEADIADPSLSNSPNILKPKP